MTKSRRDLILAVVLVAFFVFSFVKNVKRAPAPAVPAAAVPDVQEAVNSLELVRQNEKNVSAQEAFWEKDWGRDPFFSVGNEASAGARLILSGIVWDAQMPIAMINEKVVKAGDVIEGYRIETVKPGSVVVVGPSGREDEVQLFEALSD